MVLVIVALDATVTGAAHFTVTAVEVVRTEGHAVITQGLGVVATSTGTPALPSVTSGHVVHHHIDVDPEISVECCSLQAGTVDQ